MTYTLHEILQAYGSNAYCEKLSNAAARECLMHRVEVRHATIGWVFAGLLLSLAIIAAIRAALERGS